MYNYFVVVAVVFVVTYIMYKCYTCYKKIKYKRNNIFMFSDLRF